MTGSFLRGPGGFRIPADGQQVHHGGQRLLKRRQIEAVDDAGAVLLGHDQAGVPQRVEMAGERRAGQGKTFRQLAGRHVALPQ
jgi:hypothetical protein